MEKDPRLKTVNKFMTGMTDIKIKRHPLRTEVDISLCRVERDNYGDTESFVESKYKKLVILKKNVDLTYINNDIGVLVDDGETLPWVMVLTLTGLPRTLRHGDFITTEGQDYKISCVKPVNRENPDIIMCLVHPSRDDFQEVDKVNNPLKGLNIL